MSARVLLLQPLTIAVFSHDLSVNNPQEISILKSISYDRNIVQFYGAVLSGSEPMLVLEYMQVCGPS